jgi:putative solute:sodium symporter small subunit
MERPMQLTNAQTHWVRTRKLMAAMLALWMLLSIGLPLLAAPLDVISIPYFDVPLGLFMTEQVTPILFLLMRLVLAHRQDRIDRDHLVSLLGRPPSAGSRAWLEALHAPGGLHGRDSPGH